jgi:uncharacterized protein (TIGR03492 family)
MTKHKGLLLVSNGHAEDLAAACIGAGIQKKAPDIKVRALPLVGMGKAYDERGIQNLGLKKMLPSGGFAKEGLGYLLQDLFSGLFSLLLKQISILKAEGKKSGFLVCVGDIFLVALCGIFARAPIIFIDGPGSVRIRKYFAVEKWILKRYCKKVITQDEESAEFLRRSNIPGLYLGTWVMDYVTVTGQGFEIDKNKTVIGILPGTREEAYDNLLLILEVMEALNRRADKNEALIGLVASVLDRAKIKDKLNQGIWDFQETASAQKDKGIMARITSRFGTTILLVEGRFGDVCKSAKLIVGLAGIANEQAAGLGIPVVAFPGRGPQTTLRRWKEIQRITGDSMAILNGSADEIATKVWEILRDPQRLQEMGQIGLKSKKDQGATQNIINLILEILSEEGNQP